MIVTWTTRPAPARDSRPPVEELPFYDEERHDVMRPDERAEMANAPGQYCENLRTGTKPGDEN